MTEKLLKIAETVASKYGYFLIDAEIRGSRSNKIAEFFVDSEIEIDLEILSTISTNIWNKMESEELTKEFSKINVSSPGVERAFKFPEQIKKHSGRTIEVLLNNGNKLEGILKDVAKNNETTIITIIEHFSKSKKEKEQVEKSIAFSDIKESKIKLNFNK